jgi:hypothetical protein
MKKFFLKKEEEGGIQNFRIQNSEFRIFEFRFVAKRRTTQRFQNFLNLDI